MTRTITAAITAAITGVTLTACASSTPQPAPQDTTTAPPTASQDIAPVITPYDTSSATVALDNVIVITGAPDNLTAETTPDGILEYIPATNDGTMTTNPGLQPLAPGTTTVTFTSPAGTTTMNVTITEPKGNGALIGPSEAERVATEIIGMRDTDAQAHAASKNISYRVGMIDGQPQGTTRDYRDDRVTVELQDGTVTAATVG